MLQIYQFASWLVFSQVWNCLNFSSTFSQANWCTKGLMMVCSEKKVLGASCGSWELTSDVMFTIVNIGYHSHCFHRWFIGHYKMILKGVRMLYRELWSITRVHSLKTTLKTLTKQKPVATFIHYLFIILKKELKKDYCAVKLVWISVFFKVRH